jgi:hypothetical protein
VLAALAIDGGAHPQRPVAAASDGETHRLKAVRGVLQLLGHEGVEALALGERDETGVLDREADLITVEQIVPGREEVAEGNIGNPRQRSLFALIHLEDDPAVGSGLVLGIHLLGVVEGMAPGRMSLADLPPGEHRAMHRQGPVA